MSVTTRFAFFSRAPTPADTDGPKLEEGLHRLAAEDPSLKVGVEPESGHVPLSGMGELHLEVIVERLKTEYGVEARVGQPKVAYRDTLMRRVRRGHGALRAGRSAAGGRKGAAAART